MASLQGVPPMDFWRDLIRFANGNSGVTASLTTLEDGKGTALPVDVSTTTVNFTNVAQVGGQNIANSSGTTGGTGSAGAGNQYIELRIGSTTYKVLHDGTV